MMSFGDLRPIEPSPDGWAVVVDGAARKQALVSLALSVGRSFSHSFHCRLTFTFNFCNLQPQSVVIRSP